MDSSLHRREMSKRRKPSKARHRHAQYYETDQESVSRILDRKRRRTIPVTPGLSGRDSNEWVLEPSLTLDEDENLHRKQIDEKIRNSKGDKSAIIYRKMSDPARNFHSTDSESEDGFGATIELKNTILKTANSRSLRSRKNRSGVCLEKKEQEEIEHFIDELNPSGKRKKTNDVYCEDSQDSLSDYSVSRAPPADIHNGMEAVNNTNIPVDEGRKTTHVSASSNSSPPYDKWKNLMEDKKTTEEFTYKQTTKRFVLIVTTLFLSSAFLLFITLFFKDQT